MRNRFSRTIRRRAIASLCGMGLLGQFGGCEIGMITTSTTIDGREALISIIRGALLTPIDAFITGAVNEVFGDNNN